MSIDTGDSAPSEQAQLNIEDLANTHAGNYKDDNDFIIILQVSQANEQPISLEHRQDAVDTVFNTNEWKAPQERGLRSAEDTIITTEVSHDLVCVAPISSDAEYCTQKMLFNYLHSEDNISQNIRSTTHTEPQTPTIT